MKKIMKWWDNKDQWWDNSHQLTKMANNIMAMMEWMENNNKWWTIWMEWIRKWVVIKKILLNSNKTWMEMLQSSRKHRLNSHLKKHLLKKIKPKQKHQPKLLLLTEKNNHLLKHLLQKQQNLHQQKVVINQQLKPQQKENNQQMSEERRF